MQGWCDTPHYPKKCKDKTNAWQKVDYARLYPTKPARPKVKKLSMNAIPLAFPSAIVLPIPPVTRATSRHAFCHGVIANVCVPASLGVGGGVTCGGIVRGTGGRGTPPCRTIEPRTTSSSRSILNLPSPPIDNKNFVMLFE